MDDVLLVGGRGGDAPARLSGYDRESLEHLWTVDGSSPASCGQVVCVDVESNHERGTSVVAVEPGTGIPSWTIACAGADGREATSVRQMEPTGRIWVEQRPAGMTTAGGPPEVRAWVADAADGRPLTRVTHWHLAGHLDDSDLLLVRDAGVDRRAPGGPDPPPNRFWWARADLDLTETRVLGVVEADHCRPLLPYLLCEREGGRLTIWRINR